MEGMMTVAEASEALRVSKFTIYRWIREGRLPAAKPGLRFLIPREAVEELVRPQWAVRPKEPRRQRIESRRPLLPWFRFR